MMPLLPFVSRAKEIASLRRCHADGRHVLILGRAGVGKSALISHLGGIVPLAVCPQSERLSDICDALEKQLGVAPHGGRLTQRKNCLLRLMAERRLTVVFDGVAWATPKLSSFLECVSERVPIWVAARSEHPWDIGHIWPLLVRFERIEVRPFHLAETRMLLEAAAGGQFVPAQTLEAAARLHQLSAGNPRILLELLEGLASGSYDPHKRFDLNLLDLDRRIKQVPLPVKFHPAKK